MLQSHLNSIYKEYLMAWGNSLYVAWGDKTVYNLKM